MNSDEISFFKKYLEKCTNYLEYGSGGSTLFAIENGVNNIISIETDRQWYNKLTANTVIKQNITNGNLQLILHSLNCAWWEYVSWNKNPKKHPVDSGVWKKYSDLPITMQSPDLILIDGRFRVAVLLKLFNRIDDNTMILFHDYTIRPQYHVVEKFYDIITNKGSLQVLQKKTHIDPVLLLEEIKRYELLID